LDRMDRYQRNMTDSTHSMTQRCLVQTKLFSCFPCPLRTAILPDSAVAFVVGSFYFSPNGVIAEIEARHMEMFPGDISLPTYQDVLPFSVTFISAVWGQFAAHLILYKISPSRVSVGDAYLVHTGPRREHVRMTMCGVRFLVADTVVTPISRTRILSVMVPKHRGPWDSA
jgi:hypothetical protein